MNKIYIGNDIDTKAEIGAVTYDNPQWWDKWGPLVGEHGQRSVLVELDPPVPVASLCGTSAFMRAIACVDGDFSGYGFGVRLSAGEIQTWFNDDQIYFALDGDELNAILNAVLPEISEALKDT